MTQHISKTDFFIGTCVIEGPDLTLQVAQALKQQLAPWKDSIQLTYKGSFDKANRTSKDSYRGPGLEEGLRILQQVKTDLDLPVITDFHQPDQAMAVAAVADTLQIPAFLCRQTDMITAGAKACAHYGRRLNIKKGQFLAPWDIASIIAKATQHLPLRALLFTERGSCFGYNNLVVDMASFQIMGGLGVKTIHDCTHCVQQPGALGKTSGGKREQITVLAKAAAAAGADGFFMECHPHPSQAKSDAATSLPLEEIAPLVQTLLAIKQAAAPAVMG